MSTDTWMVVRRSRTIPGGYRVVRSRLTEDMARRCAAEYKRPHEAMPTKTLIELRMAAMDPKEESDVRS